MTKEDLIKAGKDQVRSNSDLMSAYKKIFSQEFGREPDCAGCTFNRDWERLTNSSNTQIQEIMSDKSFKLKNNAVIYSYDVEDKNAGRKLRKRAYGNVMTEEFAENYLTHGTEQQIAERKKQFSLLPKKFADAPEVKLSKLTVPKLQELAVEKEYPKEEWDNLKKDDLVLYLENKAIEAE